MAEAAKRACVFCGGPAETAEHVLPKWLEDLFPDDAREYEDIRHVPGEASRVDVWGSTSVVGRVVNRVCQPCNNGWMSRMENHRAKPALLPLLQSDHPLSRPLDAQTQADLATWAVKTALVAELSNPDTRIASDALARQVMDRQAPCDGAGVYLAYYDGAWMKLSYNHGVRGYPPFSLTTIQLHRVLFQVFLWGGGGTINVPEVEHASRNQQIWPLTGREVIWPSVHPVPGSDMASYILGVMQQWPLDAETQRQSAAYQAREDYMATHPAPLPTGSAAPQPPRRKRSTRSARRRKR